jgi:DNA polymerase-3 subunit epsilon
VENCVIQKRFQGLMDPGFPVTSFIESLTGINNTMLASAPPCEEVMQAFVHFIGEYPLVAHNASFDRKFLDAELARLGGRRKNEITCSMLAARRVFPEAANHRLATLVDHCAIYNDGTFHRALADAEMTAHLWIAMMDRLHELFDPCTLSFSLMQQLTVTGKSKIQHLFRPIRVKKQ